MTTELSDFATLWPEGWGTIMMLGRSDSMADFKYGVNTDVNIGVSVSRGGNTLFEVMGIC